MHAMSIRCTSDAKPNKASRLRKVLTVLWKMRAQWRRLAGEIEQITEDDCEVSIASYVPAKAGVLGHNYRHICMG